MTSPQSPSYQPGDKVLIVRNEWSVVDRLPEHNLQLGSTAEVLSVQGEDIMVAGVGADNLGHMFQEVQPRHIAPVKSDG